MGKVFTAEEIELGHIPEPGAHLEAAQFIVDQLFYDQKAFWEEEGYIEASKPFVDSGIHSGLVYGSSIHGTANVRSDLDVLILHYPSYHDTLDVVHDVFTEAEERYHVPIEANIISIPDALSSNHNIDPVFLKYLKEAQENGSFSWQWPADTLADHMPDYDQLALARFVRRYIGAKSGNFGKALALDSEMDAHKLQRAFELPKNVGRKVLSMYDPSFSAVAATGEDIASGLSSFMTDREFSNGIGEFEQASLKLRYLLQEDERYSVKLHKAIEGSISLSEYNEWIEDVRRSVVTQALLVCEPIGNAVDRFIRELKSPDWSKVKDEIESVGSEKTIDTQWLDMY